jgi:hypothetical protein
MTTVQKISAMQNLKRNGKLEANDLPDELNPKYLFSMTQTELLCAIVNGKIDTKELAWQELRNRGCDAKGSWVGFDGFIKGKTVKKPF